MAAGCSLCCRQAAATAARDFPDALGASHPPGSSELSHPIHCKWRYCVAGVEGCLDHPWHGMRHLEILYGYSILYSPLFLVFALFCMRSSSDQVRKQEICASTYFSFTLLTYDAKGGFLLAMKRHNGGKWPAFKSLSPGASHAVACIFIGLPDTRGNFAGCC